MTTNYILEFIDVESGNMEDRISPLVPRIGERVRVMKWFYRVKDIDYQFKSDAIWTEREGRDYRPVISIHVIRVPSHPEF